MKKSLIQIIFLFLLIPVVCSGQDMRLGLEETPAELYKSLRLAKPNPANGEKPGLGITDRGVDLTGLMPPVGYQGELNSCTTWAAGYAVKSFQENVERKCLIVKFIIQREQLEEKTGWYSRESSFRAPSKRARGIERTPKDGFLCS